MRANTPIVLVVVPVRESPELHIRCEGWLAETLPSAREFLNRPGTLFLGAGFLTLLFPALMPRAAKKRIAVKRADMPIIFITGYGDVPKTVQAMKTGLSNF